MADVTYEHLPPERQHALLTRRLQVAEEDHFRLALQEEAPLPDAPGEKAVGEHKKRLEDSITKLRERRDSLEKANPSLKKK